MIDETGKHGVNYKHGMNDIHNTGCLIIHGFGGNYDEVGPLVNRLKKTGYKVVCPALAGHTGRRFDLRKARYTDWISSAERGLLGLTSRCRSVYIIGFSMGGLIAFNLALKHPVAGIVTINTPIYYWDVRKILSNIVKGLTGGGFAPIRRYLRAVVKFPLRSLINFRILLARTKPLVNDITCPVLVTQGWTTIPPGGTAPGNIRKRKLRVKRIKYYKTSDTLCCTAPLPAK